MAFADAHIHLFTPDDLATYDSLSSPDTIDAALVVGFEGTPKHAGNNDLILAVTRDRSDLLPLAFMTAEQASPEQIAAVAASGFRGISLYVTDEVAAERVADWPAELVAAVAEHCGIVSVNVRAHLIDRVAAVLSGFAPANVLVSHLGLPGRFSYVPGHDEAAAVLGGLLAMSAQDHVGVKLSAFYATTQPRHLYPYAPARAFVDVLMDGFGPNRCYWGSDFPPALRFGSFQQAADCYLPPSLSDADRARVMGDNLRALVSAPGARAGSEHR